MTAIYSNTRYRLFRLLIAGLLLSVGAVHTAYAGSCTNTAGENILAVNVGSLTITDAQNVAGQVADPFTEWDGQGQYTIKCDCRSLTASRGRWAFSASMFLPASEPGWYALNEFLSVKVRSQVKGASPSEIPFSNLGTGSEESYKICEKSETLQGVGSGTSGDMGIKITRPILGSVSINNVKIAGLWICYNTPASDECAVKGESNLNYYFSGSITAPTNCTINAGQVVSVDLGTVYSGEFNGVGEKPQGYTPRSVKIPVQCSSGIDAMATLQFRISATASSDLESAIKTSNNGVGILIEDKQGNIIKPNTTETPFPLSNSHAEIEFNASPVSTTGTFTQSGPYNATATIAVEYD
ncbi:fimbrial protein [Enterobacteriaceae bacterium G50]|nr:fimbrial protein [Enterobacteriaceae bacterium G50]